MNQCKSDRLKSSLSAAKRVCAVVFQALLCMSLCMSTSVISISHLCTECILILIIEKDAVYNLIPWLTL